MLLDNTWPDISLFWEEFGPSFEEKWITVYPWSFVQRLIKIGSVVLEENIFRSWQGDLLFLNYFSLVEGRGLHLNKPKFPLLKDDLHHVWLKLAEWFWRRRFSKVSMWCFLLITHNYGHSNDRWLILSWINHQKIKYFVFMEFTNLNVSLVMFQ